MSLYSSTGACYDFFIPRLTTLKTTFLELSVEGIKTFFRVVSRGIKKIVTNPCARARYHDSEATGSAFVLYP